MGKREEFLKKILATFKIEAEENIASLSVNLIELEKNPPEAKKAELLEVIYRSAHSLKGASRAVSLISIEQLCHKLEDVFSALRDDVIILTSNEYDLLHNTLDLIGILVNTDNDDSGLDKRISDQMAMLTDLESGTYSDSQGLKTRASKKSPSDSTNTEDIKLDTEINKENPKAENNTVSNNKDKSELLSKNNIIRVNTDKLDKLLNQTEELLSIKLNTIHHSNSLKGINNNFDTCINRRNTLSSSIANLNKIIKEEGSLEGKNKDISNIIELLNWTDEYTKSIKKEVSILYNKALQEVYSTGAKVESLLNNVRDLSSVQFSSITDLLPKMIRDISKDLGKEVTFSIVGDEIEADRRVLEKVKISLIHIIRNSIDYGIEKPQERLNKGKHSSGKISISISQIENNKIEIRIEDDGAGIDEEKLKEIYFSNEKVTSGLSSKINRKEYLNYIFKSGVTTSNIVTDLSGRGLGLAIVQESVEQVGGNINVETKKDVSTIFIITIPQSIVTFRGVLLETSGQRFLVATSKLQKVLRVRKSEVETVDGKNVAKYNNTFIPLINLSSILELEDADNQSEFMQVLVFSFNGEAIAFYVDKIITDQEVLVKNFNKQLLRVRNFEGATILASGELVPVLNVNDLYRSSKKVTSAGILVKIDQNKETNKSILVVEDSITSRTLLKNILEASGYDVTTSVDGIDGYTKLVEGHFDAVVSDVEMPRMNGFELTEKIRSDKNVKNIPVLLVTSLSKREDKERGIAVGANAYIVKSNFDQSNLLEILERLI
jgi:two-component system chemotaxis sensor kinase CheA